MKKYQYKINKTSLELNYNEKCFVPTATSDFIIKACVKNFKTVNNLLDLGCGIGIVGLSLHTQMNINKLYSSDISEDAIKYCKLNSIKYKINNNIKKGTLYEPWGKYKFDLIVNDISGISEDVARLSPWFRFAPCDSGSDGLKLSKKIINESHNYLIDKGCIIFPVISLSDYKGLLKYANSKFKSLKKLSSNEWFLPDKMTEDNDIILKKLRDKGNIYFYEKFGKKVCFTDIYIGNF